VPVEPGVTEVGVFEFTVSPKIVTGDAPTADPSSTCKLVLANAVHNTKMKMLADFLRIIIAKS